MNISSTSSSNPSADTTQVDRATLVMKKQQDVAKDQGQALVDLVKQSATTSGFSAYA